MSFTPGKIRARVNVAKRESWIDEQTGASPAAPKGFALDIEIGFFVNTSNVNALEIMDFSGFSAVTVEIHDNQYKTRPAVASVTCTDFDTALTPENWLAGTAFHCKAEFDENDMALDLGANSGDKNFWIYIHGIDGNGKRRALGGTTLNVYETGASNVTPGPNQGGNIVPGGAVYDGSGNYVLAVTQDKRYEWTDGGADDTSVVNGTETITATRTVFTAQGSSITLKGTAGAAVTALIRYPLYYTADEVESRIENADSDLPSFQTFVNGSFKRTIGIDENGNRIDHVETI